MVWVTPGDAIHGYAGRKTTERDLSVPVKGKRGLGPSWSAADGGGRRQTPGGGLLNNLGGRMGTVGGVQRRT